MGKEWYKSKTIWTAIAAGVLTTIYQLGYVDASQFQTIGGVLAAFGLYALRDGIGKPIAPILKQ